MMIIITASGRRAPEGAHILCYLGVVSELADDSHVGDDVWWAKFKISLREDEAAGREVAEFFAEHFTSFYDSLVVDGTKLTVEVLVNPSELQTASITFQSDELGVLHALNCDLLIRCDP